MNICETCDYANRPPYKSPCSECDRTMGSLFCYYEHEEKPTNADRIRAMSDEELANVVANGVGCVLSAPHCMDDDCTYCILKWLKQPVKEDAE